MRRFLVAQRSRINIQTTSRYTCIRLSKQQLRTRGSRLVSCRPLVLDTYSIVLYPVQVAEQLFYQRIDNEKNSLNMKDFASLIIF